MIEMGGEVGAGLGAGDGVRVEASIFYWSGLEI